MHSSVRSSIRSFTRWRARTLAVVVVLLCLSMLPPGGPLASLAPPVAHAAMLAVTSTADSGAGSLRDQIAAASNGDTITFNLAANSTITLNNQIDVFVALTIDGAGAPGLTISGNSTNRIFEISAPVALANMTLADGLAENELTSQPTGAPGRTLSGKTAHGASQFGAATLAN